MNVIANRIAYLFGNNEEQVFIEVEGKEERIKGFIQDYNAAYSENLDINDDGVIVLGENVDKWGLEFRCYFNNKDGFPAEINITKNRVYRKEYAYRFNDIRIINALFDLGFRIGAN